ncbi:hypothetical protein Z043_106947 [Scleropages formosus]|uniref:Major intrinsically disordered Notch2-binding receptor 1-like C-terminal domain-containing protein n=1 Tax=Scleropages formosus TaxID=113540 RepID=A0A0P7XEP8_SCLFO|nr:hypothetical protein Z043_106947 [Scleropages formosus]
MPDVLRGHRIAECHWTFLPLRVESLVSWAPCWSHAIMCYRVVNNSSGTGLLKGITYTLPRLTSCPCLLQAQESLNPNHMEYWMEDIYSPGYDSLLKRKEAEFRRAKACKIGVLIAAAACTVILVIVVPMCTMKS